MLKFIYTNPDGSVSIINAAPKEVIEHVLGPLTDLEYKAHILEVSVPNNATNVREISDNDIPENREFRGAWCDVTNTSAVDIDLVKVKSITLSRLRETRDAALSQLDAQTLIAVERNEDLSLIVSKKQALRDATEPLKALEVSGFNDAETTNTIKKLAVLPE